MDLRMPLHRWPESQPEVGVPRGVFVQMTKTILKVLLVFAALGLCRLSAQADQLYVCQPSPTQKCTSPPGGTAVGGESNLITNTGSIDVGAVGRGRTTLSRARYWLLWPFLMATVPLASVLAQQAVSLSQPL